MQMFRIYRRRARILRLSSDPSTSSRASRRGGSASRSRASRLPQNSGGGDRQRPALLDEELILLGDLVLTETLQGFSSERAAAAALEKLRAFAFVSMVGWEMAVKAAENYRVLRRKGVTIRKTVNL